MESRELLAQSIHAQWPTPRWSQVTTLVAVSGGADSVALLRALHQLKPANSAGKLHVLHFNHKLRGSESEADEQFVQDLASSLRLECLTGRAPRPATLPVSEDDARRLRYFFFRQAAAESGARYVALAHTADDQAETILFRAIRGTGVSGLAGMPFSRMLNSAVTLIRPVLHVRRADLRSYLASLDQSFREDSSNRDRRYARNRLRCDLIPRLTREYDPAIIDSLLQLGRQASELAEATRQSADAAIDQAVELTPRGFRIHRDRLPSLSRHAMREIFVQLWHRFDWPRNDMSFADWDELVRFLFADFPPRIFPGGIRVEKMPEHLSCQQV